MNKKYQEWMGGKKKLFTLYRYYDCVNTKKSTNNLLELISQFRKVVDFCILILYSIVFLHASNKHSENG